MLKIKVEIQRGDKKIVNNYSTNRKVNMKLFREIWRLLRDEIEQEIGFPLHHHSKKEYYKCDVCQNLMIEPGTCRLCKMDILARIDKRWNS